MAQSHRLAALDEQLPEFIGTLCQAPHEATWVLSINDEPVTTKEIERSIIERAFEEGWIVP